MTARQKLVKAATTKLLIHNVRSVLGKPGYHWIYPKTRQMNELIEGVARELGGDVWEYYLAASDRAYYMLEREVAQARENLAL